MFSQKKEMSVLHRDNLTSSIIKILLYFLLPGILFYVLEGLEHNAWMEVRSTAQFLNVILFELLFWFLFFLSGSAALAFRLEILCTAVFGLTNHYVMDFRSTPFVPWDIYSVKTAANVVENYDFTLTKEVLSFVFILIFLFVIVGFIKLKFPFGILYRVIPSICICIIIWMLGTSLQNEEFQRTAYLYPFLFTPAYMTKVNGMLVTFVMNLAFVRVEKPVDYSVQEVEALIADYSVPQTIPEELPNIVVIMDEAFSDLGILGEFTTNEDYMPYIHSLQKGKENTITGNLEVSVCGGNTANSEFEFLTGHSMDYFPSGSIPYQQYVKREIPSLANQLQKLGYESYGMHPYRGNGWNREQVYPLLGFTEAYFLEEFEGSRYIRKYISDQSAFQKVIDLYENKEKEHPLFMFLVTMQNHGGYTKNYKNFKPHIKVNEKADLALEQYLSLIQTTDEAFSNLIQYFEQEDEKTVILFFGDHQPNDFIANKIYSINGKKQNTISSEKEKERYMVPYVLWANFDIEEERNRDIDISYLSAYLLETIQMPLNSYQQFLLEEEQVLSEDSPMTDREKKKYKLMHQKLQYYYMFDYEHKKVWSE